MQGKCVHVQCMGRSARFIRSYSSLWMVADRIASSAVLLNNNKMLNMIEGLFPLCVNLQ